MVPMKAPAIKMAGKARFILYDKIRIVGMPNSRATKYATGAVKRTNDCKEDIIALKLLGSKTIPLHTEKVTGVPSGTMRKAKMYSQRFIHKRLQISYYRLF